MGYLELLWVRLFAIRDTTLWLHRLGPLVIKQIPQREIQKCEQHGRNWGMDGRWKGSIRTSLNSRYLLDAAFVCADNVVCRTGAAEEVCCVGEPRRRFIM